VGKNSSKGNFSDVSQSIKKTLTFAQNTSIINCILSIKRRTHLIRGSIKCEYVTAVQAELKKDFKA
jgi:hypothetical protein